MIEPRLMIIFGSRVSGNARTDSDYDVAILAEDRISFEDKIKFVELTAQKLGVPEDLIDIVDLQVASPLLKRAVAETGELIFGTKEDFFTFRFMAWKEYIDTAKFRRYRSTMLHKGIA